MKKFLKFIFFSAVLLAFPPVFAAEEPAAPAGEKVESELRKGKFPLLEQLFYLFDYYSEIDKKYPDADLMSADITDTVREMYPHASPQEIYDKSDSIKSRLQLYRYARQLYLKITGDMLAPPPPPLIVDDEDYERPDTGDYIESDDLVVINDFKKVLSYSYDKRDIEAIEARIERDRAKASGNFENLKRHVKKLEFKKLPFYGLVYDDPFTGRKGIGDWTAEEALKGRLLSAESELGEGQAIKAAVQVEIPAGKFLWAADGKTHYKPRLDLTASSNLSSYRLYWPLPQRLYHDKTDYTVYGGTLVLPLELWAADKNKPLLLQGKLQFQLCDFSGCNPRSLELKLDLAPGTSEASAVNNFIVNNFNLLPPAEDDNLTVKRLVVDKPLSADEPQVLRAVIDIDTALSEFDIFIENKDGIEFYAPRITIDGRRIIARFTAVDNRTDLVGKEFVLTAKIGKFVSLRQKFTAEIASVFDTLRPELSWGLVFLAFIGGFILNFMPCVFPALSLKLMSFSSFGGSNEQTVRRGFALTAGGIFIGFVIITALLYVFKFIGLSLGWGMQFQNPVFLILMMSVMVLFIAQIHGLINISLPSFRSAKTTDKKNKSGLPHLLAGIFVVLLATPCTAPYLGTAVGFALAGTYWDIAIIMSAVAAGLALPYLLISGWPDIALAVPKPGAWQEKLQRFMVLMLFVTLLWLLSVFASQSSWTAALRQGFYLLLIWFIFWFRSLIFQQLDAAVETEDAKIRSRRFFLQISRLLLAVFLAVSLIDGNLSFGAHRCETLKSTVSELDYDYIRSQVASGRTVFVSIGADWCLTCRFNQITVLHNDMIKEYLRRHSVVTVDIDWTGYNPRVLEFMEKFGRKGLPFYVIFSPKVPDGLVLPEILTEKDLRDILREAV